MSIIRNRDLFTRFFDSPLYSVATGDRSQPIDVIERPTEYELRFVAAGATKEIDVNVENNTLNIEVCRETDQNDDDTVIMKGIQDFCFKRSVNLSNANVKTAAITSTYKNGVLSITIPKADEALPKKISVAVE
jgi:HSP20 family protein